MTAAQLLRETRERHGISQRSLARRASTSQAWISAVERGEASPTVDALARLLLCMGEQLELGSSRLASHRDHDPEAFARVRGASMEQRLADGAAWSELASSIHVVGDD